MIGGNAPSHYLAQLQSHPQVGLGAEDMDAILRTHLIDPQTLRADAFEAFHAARKQALLLLIGKAMGKEIAATASSATLEPEPEEDVNDEDGMNEVTT